MTKRAFWIGAMAVLLVMTVAPAASAATLTPFDKNLLVNPDAEAGAGTRGYTHVDIPGWSSAGDGTVVRYGSPEFPTTAESTRIGGGRKFFSCGPHGGDVINQMVKVRSRSAMIDAGQVEVRVKGLIATFDSQSDSGRIQVIPLNQQQLAITQLTTPTVTKTNGIFRVSSMSQALPAGTRFVLIRLLGSDVEGDYCDAYFDHVSLKLRQIKA